MPLQLCAAFEVLPKNQSWASKRGDYSLYPAINMAETQNVSTWRLYRLDSSLVGVQSPSRTGIYNKNQCINRLKYLGKGHKILTSNDLSIFWHVGEKGTCGVPWPLTCLIHLDHFNLPPTVKQKRVLLKRKLFLLPPYIDQMTTSPSPSSLSEFKGSKMVRISSNRKPAGLLQKEFKHFILCKVVKKGGGKVALFWSFTPRFIFFK